MDSAVRLVVRRVRRSVWIGLGVVNVARHRGFVAAGPAAGQIAAADEPRQSGRRAVVRFCDKVFGDADRAQGGPRRQLGDPLGGQHTAGQIAGLGAGALDGGGLGQHVDNDLAAGGFGSGCRALIGSAGARHRDRTGGQRAQRIGAALRRGARIVRAHRGRELVEFRVEGRRVGGAHTAPDLGHPVLAGLDLDMAVEVALTRHPHRFGIQLDHQPVDQLGDLLPRELVPLRRRAGQLRVDLGQHGRVGDQVGAKDRRGDNAKVHRAGHKHLSQLREALHKRGSVAHLRGRPPAADAQFGTNFGGDGLPVIDAPEVVLAGHALHAALGKPAHRQQLTRKPRPLSSLGLTHQLEQLRVTTSSEHIFDHRRFGGQTPPRTTSLWITCGSIADWG
jgi:hypothetical protein